MNIFDIFRIKKPIPAPWEKYYSKEELDVKIPNISMYDQVRLSTYRYPKNKAVEYLGRNITYRKLLRLINRAARAFRRLGIKKGDIVTICLPNVPEALISLYALNKLGAIGNMLHPLSAEEEIKQSLIATKSTYLILIDLYYEKIENTIGLTDVKKVIFVSAANSMNKVLGTLYKISQIGKFKRYPHNKMYMSWTKFMRMGKMRKNGEYQRFGCDAPAVILHSGGTSGSPKNVVLQNRAFVLASKQEKTVLKNIKPGDCCLAIMPNFHGFGLSVCMHTPLALGCYTIMIPTFDAKKFDTLFKKTRPTSLFWVYQLYLKL